MGEVVNPNGIPSENLQPSRKLLPVGRDVITKTLSRIDSHQSGEKLGFIKMNHVRAKDPYYAELMGNFFGLYQSAMRGVGESKNRSYYYGVTTFFDILEEQAKEIGAEIPTLVIDDSVDRNDVNMIWRKEREALYKIANNHEDLHPNDTEGIAEQRVINLANEITGDTALGILLRKYASDYSGREAFLVGFMFAYDTMRMMIELQEQDRVAAELRQVENDFRVIDGTERTSDKDELETWRADPELVELHTIFNLLTPVEPDKPDQEVRIDTSNLGGVDFANGMADLELFLYEQGGQQE